MTKRAAEHDTDPVVAMPAERAAEPPKALPADVAVHAAQLAPGDAWKHAAAAALHRWVEHAHHTGRPMVLSAEDYAAALKAAEGPDKTGNYAPHAPALSPHTGL